MPLSRNPEISGCEHMSEHMSVVNINNQVASYSLAVLANQHSFPL